VETTHFERAELDALFSMLVDGSLSLDVLNLKHAKEGGYVSNGPASRTFNKHLYRRPMWDRLQPVMSTGVVADERSVDRLVVFEDIASLAPVDIDVQRIGEGGGTLRPLHTQPSLSAKLVV
jgi:hypothetical protein